MGSLAEAPLTWSLHCEVVWLVALLKDLNAHQSTPAALFCDNKSAFYITTNPVFYGHTKHIDIEYHMKW